MRVLNTTKTESVPDAYSSGALSALAATLKHEVQAYSSMHDTLLQNIPLISTITPLCPMVLHKVVPYIRSHAWLYEELRRAPNNVLGYIQSPC